MRRTLWGWQDTRIFASVHRRRGDRQRHLPQLRADDNVLATYREHGHALARGLSAKVQWPKASFTSRPISLRSGNFRYCSCAKTIAMPWAPHSIDRRPTLTCAKRLEATGCRLNLLTRWTSWQCVMPPVAPYSGCAVAKGQCSWNYRPIGFAPIRCSIRSCTAARPRSLSDPRVFLLGEDVGRYGGTYAVSKGLLEEFGEERIRDTPLSESAFVGAGIGAAMNGMRPIVEIMTVNVSLLALDQIINNAATLRHMSGGQISVPVVIRMTTGAGRQLAAQHSRRTVHPHTRPSNTDTGKRRRCPRNAVDCAEGPRPGTDL